MNCPKCGASMRSYERNGITIDQCNECRGVFLDRGELDRLIDLEGSAPQAPAAAPAQPQPIPQQTQQWQNRNYDDRYDNRHYGHKKRKSFLSEIFDD